MRNYSNQQAKAMQRQKSKDNLKRNSIKKYLNSCLKWEFSINKWIPSHMKAKRKHWSLNNFVRNWRLFKTISLKKRETNLMSSNVYLKKYKNWKTKSKHSEKSFHKYMPHTANFKLSYNKPKKMSINKPLKNWLNSKPNLKKFRKSWKMRDKWDKFKWEPINKLSSVLTTKDKHWWASVNL